MFEALITYSLVACAAAYAAWRLLPATWSGALLAACRQLARRIGMLRVEEGLRSRVQPSRCGSCSGCARLPPPQQPLVRR